MKEVVPSENEWLIMEVIWNSNTPVTAAQVIQQLKGIKDVSQKTIRVMINRLVTKEILAYTIDPKDARVYHYFPVKTKDECMQIKGKHFLKNFFNDNVPLAVASFLKSSDITEEQLEQLEHMVNDLKDKKR